MQRPVIIEGKNLYLSTITRGEIPLFVKWYANPEIYCYEGQPGLFTNEVQEEEWYEYQAKDSFSKNFAIVSKSNNAVLGIVMLNKLNYHQRTAELGISIGPPEARGRGYGTESVRLAIRYGFEHLSLYSISLWHVDFNERGHHAYLRAGFEEAGRHRGRFLLNGTRYDVIWMDVTREDQLQGYRI